LAISVVASLTFFSFLPASALSVNWLICYSSAALTSSSSMSFGSALAATSNDLTSFFNSLYSSGVYGVGTRASKSGVGGATTLVSAALSILAWIAAVSALLFLTAASTLASATLVASDSGAASSTTAGSAADVSP